MNPYIDSEGYLCIREELRNDDGFVHFKGNWKRYKVNTQTGLFEKVTE